MDLLIVLVKTLFFYWVIVLVYRFMGKREVGELSIVDLIVSILIAELAAMSIEQYNKSVFLSLIPMIVLVLFILGISIGLNGYPELISVFCLLSSIVWYFI